MSGGGNVTDSDISPSDPTCRHFVHVQLQSCYNACSYMSSDEHATDLVELSARVLVTFYEVLGRYRSVILLFSFLHFSVLVLGFLLDFFWILIFVCACFFPCSPFSAFLLFKHM
jgi:hypothetical protein